jgi:hypothetical protein
MSHPSKLRKQVPFCIKEKISRKSNIIKGNSQNGENLCAYTYHRIMSSSTNTSK